MGILCNSERWMKDEQHNGSMGEIEEAIPKHQQCLGGFTPWHYLFFFSLLCKIVTHRVKYQNPLPAMNYRKINQEPKFALRTVPRAIHQFMSIVTRVTNQPSLCMRIIIHKIR